MSNPRIEEVSDDDIDDPEEMDLDAFDFARPQKGGLGPNSKNDDDQSSDEDSDSDLDPEAPLMSEEDLRAMMHGPKPTETNKNNLPVQPLGQPTAADREAFQREHQQKSKAYQCLYPVYFDATRSREDGRRVKKEDAVKSPLAREIVDALQAIGSAKGIPLQVVLEPAKMHPKDWANPGRVKVLIKKDGKPVSEKIQNKHALYKLVSAHLRAHPTTIDTPLRLRIQGMPPPKDNKAPLPAIPRGFKIGEILPLHSPALSGGGVSENFFKDMMDEMGGQLPPGMEGMANMANMAGMGGGAGGGGGGGAPKKAKIIRAKK